MQRNKKKELFVQPASLFERLMYKEMEKDKKTIQQLKKILEVK